MAYNSSVHPTAGCTPFYLMFGHSTRMPIDLMYGSCPIEVNQPSNANEFVAKLQDRLQKPTLVFEILWDISWTDKRNCMMNEFMGNPSRRMT